MCFSEVFNMINDSGGCYLFHDLFMKIVVATTAVSCNAAATSSKYGGTQQTFRRATSQQQQQQPSAKWPQKCARMRRPKALGFLCRSGIFWRWCGGITCCSLTHHTRRHHQKSWISCSLHTFVWLCGHTHTHTPTEKLFWNVCKENRFVAESVCVSEWGQHQNNNTENWAENFTQFLSALQKKKTNRNFHTRSA